MMEYINISNYEAYLLEFSEGNLSKKEEANLFAFLEENPEINVDLNDLSLPKLSSKHKPHIDKSKLYKTISTEDIIAYHEDLLSKSEIKDVDEAIKESTQLQTEFDLVKKLKLIPSEITFENKATLKKSLVIPFTKKAFTTVGSIAAVLLLYFSLTQENKQYSRIDPSQNNIATITQVEEDTTLYYHVYEKLATQNQDKEVVSKNKRTKKIALEPNLKIIEKSDEKEPLAEVKVDSVSKIIPALENNESDLAFVSNDISLRTVGENLALEKEKKIAKTINTLIAPNKTEYVAQSDKNSNRYSFSVGRFKVTRISSK